jgi:hypothetical protein
MSGLANPPVNAEPLSLRTRAGAPYSSIAARIAAMAASAVSPDAA